MALTTQQQLALALDKNISVTAGAGSGKTKILVERFVKIALQNPTRVRNILAITFTKKAAGEMQERVAQEINQRLADANQAANRINLLSIRDQLSQASISTIHGFCARVLREFPIEAGLSPDFTEMDDFQQRVLLDETLEKVFRQIDNNGPKELELLFLNIEKSKIQEMLISMLQAPFEMQKLRAKFEILNEESYLESLQAQWLEIVQTYIFLQQDWRTFHQLANHIQHNSDLSSSHEKVMTTVQLINEFLNITSDEPGVELYLKAFELVTHFTGSNGKALKTVRTLGGNKVWSPQAIEAILEMSQLCEILYSRLHRHKPGQPDDESDRLWFQLFQQLLQLYQMALEVYEEEKSVRSWIDFEDLQLRTLHLLNNQPEICYQLQQRFDFIMVDEFQDTNSLQWQIISKLSETELASLAKDKVFIVGDPKQSIYGFRDADIRIFKEVKEAFASLVSENTQESNIVFRESFRFLPRLNAFINHLFSGVLQERNENPFEVSFDALQAMRQVENGGRSEWALLSEEDSEEEYIARSIHQFKQNKMQVYNWQGAEVAHDFEYGDAVILIRNRNNLLDIELALRKYNIPFKTVKGIGFWQKQEVYDLYHLLRFLSDPQDDFALVAVLRAPLFFVSDEVLYFLAQQDANTYFKKLLLAVDNNEHFNAQGQQKLEEVVFYLRKWLELRERISLTDLFHTILDDLKLTALHLAGVNGEQLVANLEKLVHQGQHFEDSGGGGLNEFVEHLDTLIENGMREGEAQIITEDSATVKIMTVHASKGLQFPLVFVPYLNTENGKQGSDFYLDSEIGLALKAQNYDQENNLLHNLLAHRQRQKEVAEAKRLFYVAVTRASNRVCLSAKLKKDKIQKDSALEWMQEIFDLESTDEVLKYKDFELTLIRQLEEVETEENDLQKFHSGLKYLSSKLSGMKNQQQQLPQYLQKIPPGKGGRIFSPTRIMTFMHNREEYYQKYHLGFFDNDYEAFAENLHQDEYGLLKGKIVHRYLELIPGWIGDVERLVEQILFEYEVFETEQQHRLVQELQEIHQQIEKSQIGRQIIFAEQAQNEVDITIRLAQDYLTGTLDRIYFTEQDSWKVADYKTNRITAKQIEPEAEKYKFQMEAYALLLSKVYPEQNDFTISLYFLHPDKLFSRQFTKTDIAKIEQQFIQIIEEIKKAFPIH